MKRQTKIITVALAAACAALAGVTVATPAQAAILASEDFSGVTLTGNTPVLLNGVNDGTGWSRAWFQQSTPAAGKGIPGYNVADTSPLTGADNSNYATGGYNFQGTGRAFDTSSAGTFGSAGLVNPTTHLIGVTGATLLMSVLLENTSGSTTLVGLGNDPYGTPNYGDAVNAGVGSYGSNHTVWNLSGSNGTNTITNVSSGSAVSLGTPVELVMKIQYTTATAANLSMWVNPAGYSSAAPTIPLATPDATMTSTDAAFSYVFFFASGNGNGAKFTDFVVATPSSSVPEPATLGLVAMGALGLLLIGRRKQT